MDYWSVAKENGRLLNHYSNTPPRINSIFLSANNITIGVKSKPALLGPHSLLAYLAAVRQRADEVDDQLRRSKSRQAGNIQLRAHLK